MNNKREEEKDKLFELYIQHFSEIREMYGAYYCAHPDGCFEDDCSAGYDKQRLVNEFYDSVFRLSEEYDRHDYTYELKAAYFRAKKVIKDLTTCIRNYKPWK